MAGFNFAPIAVQPQAQTSLSDMLNVARGAQAYQQAQQINPLQAQQAAQQLELSRIETEKAKRTLEPEVSSKESEAKRLKLVAEQAGVDVTNHYANIARGVYGGLLTDPDFVKGNSEKMVEKLNKAKNFLEDTGIPMHDSKMHDDLIKEAKSNPAQAYQLIKNGIQQGGSNAEQFQQLNAPAQYMNTGQMQVPIYQSPYQGGGPGNTPAIQNMPAPLSAGQKESLEEDVTGNKVVVTRDPNGNIIGSRPVPSNVAQPGFQSVPPGGTKETFQGQAKGAINSYLSAIHAINDVDSPATHLPTQERLAKTILQKLKNPDLDTGPIAQALAGNTKGITLTSEQQELMKLLEQRIQGLAPRTDADAQSKKDAYGSFKLKKDALMDIVRSDLGNIHKDSLLKNGIINSAGSDASNPNLAGINNFQQKFSKSSQNPILSTYIGIIGKHKDKTTIDEEDKQALKKFISENKLSGEQIKLLENERKQLIDLSSGGQ
jgi:hypothetical protein